MQERSALLELEKKYKVGELEVYKYFKITIVFTNCISTDGFQLSYIPNGPGLGRIGVANGICVASAVVAEP